MTDTVVEVRDFHKSFATGLIHLPSRAEGAPPTWLERTVVKLPGGRRIHAKIEAVRGISFDVRRGEIFGFLGPNGAGKTTTLKTLLGLIYPSSGDVRLFGKPVTDPSARASVGYLPESPYLYQYLSARECVDLCARLGGVPRQHRERQVEALLIRVGLANRMDIPVRKLSKGMLQRVGLAQALAGSPELLILDEPMSGLDPIGRKEVRDLILEERRCGRTVMFSSHILSDVEMLCDRVAIVRNGKLAAYGPMDDLLRREVRAVEIEVATCSDALTTELTAIGATMTALREHTVVTVRGEGDVSAVLAAVLRVGARVVSVTPRRETLEELFFRNAIADAPHTSG